MTADKLNHVFSALEARRRALGMSTEALARRSKVSRPTVCRILKGDHASASFKNVVAVAEALGMKTLFEPEVDDRKYLEQEAERKAKYAAALVQGTMGLESQGVNPSEKESLIREVKGRLLSGSKRKIWR